MGGRTSKDRERQEKASRQRTKSMFPDEVKSAFPAGVRWIVSPDNLLPARKSRPDERPVSSQEVSPLQVTILPDQASPVIAEVLSFNGTLRLSAKSLREILDHVFLEFRRSRLYTESDTTLVAWKTSVQKIQSERNREGKLNGILLDKVSFFTILQSKEIIRKFLQSSEFRSDFQSKYPGIDFSEGKKQIQARCNEILEIIPKQVSQMYQTLR